MIDGDFHELKEEGASSECGNQQTNQPPRVYRDDTTDNGRHDGRDTRKLQKRKYLSSVTDRRTAKTKQRTPRLDATRLDS